MLIIKTPATSANLSVGFDTLGLALNLYNEYKIENSDEMLFYGFNDFENDIDNLFQYSYSKFYEKYASKNTMKKIKCTLTKNDIPISRGLGSSASMILAGVLASNSFNNLNISFDECVEFAASVEGHSDNVFACAYGKLTASTYIDSGYYHQTFDVDSNYIFYILIPSRKGSTKVSRSLLPKKILLEDAVNNLSKIVMLPTLFGKYNFDLLKKILVDKVHEQYRYPYIPLYNDIKKESEKENRIISISGSGPSVLMISKDHEINIPDVSKIYSIKRVYVCQGLTMEVDE